MTPAKNIAVPCLEGIVLNTDNEILQNSFIAILEKAMDNREVDSQHPAFPKILAQLSVDEILICYTILKDESFIYKHENELDIYTITSTTFPKNNMSNDGLFEQYIQNLSQSGIIKSSSNMVSAHSGRWDSASHKIVYPLNLSSYGKQFLKACLNEKSESLLKDTELALS